MTIDFTKSERKTIRKLAELAWERQLRSELHKIAIAITDMDKEVLSPFEVNQKIHAFHNGVSRELFNRYSDSLPWFPVCRAHYDKVLSDDDLMDASDKIRNGISKFAKDFVFINELESSDDPYEEACLTDRSD